MPSPDVVSEHTGSTEPRSQTSLIQNIIQSLRKLHKLLSEAKAEADSPQPTTEGTNAAANNQTGNEQHGSNSRYGSQGNSDDTNKQEGDVSKERSNKQNGDVSQENQEGSAQEIKNTVSNQRKEALHEWGKALHELDKVCKELMYMISSFEKLEKFETNLGEPLNTLEANVNDILRDLRPDKVNDLPKQVPFNLRVLRNNITRVKIQIPLQHQTANTNSEANRALQTTVATREVEDLPQLYNEGKFESSYYFKEIEEKYNALTDKGEILCLLCFAIFPENAEIKKRLLRFWWVGEYLVPDTKDEKDFANEKLKKFVKMGFIEPVQKKNKLPPRSYKMNPIVRACLIKFAKDARFFDYDSKGKPTMDFLHCKKACMVKSEEAPAPWLSDYLKKLKEQGSQGLSADLVKLQMLFNFPRQKDPEAQKKKLEDASRQFHELKTLFNISKQFPALPMEWFSKMTGLNVLYLGSWESSAGRQRHIEVDDINFFKGFKKMKKLRLLSLQGISGISKIPSTLCKLENLRILDLRACHNLEKLSDRIGSLKKLTYLDLSECYLLDGMPKKLNQLSELRVLKGFVIVDGKNLCTLADLSELSNLRKLSVNVNTMKFDVDDAGKVLSKFQKLEKLKIAWGAGGLKGNNSKTMKVENRKQGNGSQDVGSVNKVVMRLRSKLERKSKKHEAEDLEKLELVKLDLQCFPRSTPPDWLVPQKMINLQKLSIRGGRLSHLIDGGEERKWKVDNLRLKFLMDFKMNWKEMQKQFPDLTYLENVRCPRITFCPCDANGVWEKKG